MDVLFLHGPAAAGKYTIGSILSQSIGIPLFHNHLAVDLAKTLFEFGTSPFIRLREEIWLSSFTIAAESGRSFLFTFNPEATVDGNLIGRLQEIVASTNGHVHFVELTCPEEEILKRLGNESRGDFGKLTDPDLYREIKRRGGFDFPALPEPLVSVDTGRLSPEAAAAKIRRAFENRET